MVDETPKEILAVIPARGGSKSIPQKNIRLVAGKPLIAYSIEVAKRSKFITRVVVSTDDPLIAEVARRFGAEVPFMRPADLAEDDTPDLPVFHHALNWLREREGYEPDLVVHLRPTTPNRRPETVDRAIRAFLDSEGIDSLRTVRPAYYSPYKMWLMNTEGMMDPVVRPPGIHTYNLPRQSLPKAFQGDGYVDVTRPEVILEMNSMLGSRIKGFIVDEPCVDIDDENDLWEAERILAGSAVSGEERIDGPSR